MLQAQGTDIKSELLEMMGHIRMAVITGYLRYGAAGETDKKEAFVRHGEGRWST